MWQTGAIRIARIGGITIDLHFTFILIVLVGAWQGWERYGGWLGAGYGALIVIVLFASTLFHEFGHGLRARVYGLVVRRITLFPFGGLAQLETPPSSSWQELVIALAGPLASLGVALAFAALILLFFPLKLLDLNAQLLLLFFLPPSLLGTLLMLMWVNLSLAAFNMIPAFPMDGGRVLRSGLAMLFDYELATRLAAWLGRIIALGLCILGFIGWPPKHFPPNALFAIMGVIIYFGARYEELYVRRRRALVRVEAGEICHRPAETVAPWDSLSPSLIAHLFRHERVVPVVADDRLLGLLSHLDMRRISRASSSVTVAHAMQTDFPVLGLHDTLWVALREMNKSQLAALPVVEGDIFYGMVSLEDISHAWRIAPFRRQPKDSTFAPGDTISQ